MRRALLAAAALAALVPAAALAAGVRARTGTVSVDSFTAGAASATCPPGSVPVGGGFRTTTNDATGLVVTSLLPTARTGWAVGATNEFVNPGSVTAIAYCGARTPLRRVVASATLPAQSGGAYPDATVTARCPRGPIVRFGGFTATRRAAGPCRPPTPGRRRARCRPWPSAARGRG
jgi:hypothetical protein